MCLTNNGSEVSRVSIVDENGEVVYDEIVLPQHEITDYLTIYSGITEEMIKNCSKSKNRKYFRFF